MSTWIRQNGDLLAVAAIAAAIPYRSGGASEWMRFAANPEQCRFVYISNVADTFAQAAAAAVAQIADLLAVSLH